MADVPSPLQCYAVRLKPGEELYGSLVEFVKKKHLLAPFILTCVGSVTQATLRLANATAQDPNKILEVKGCHEIVSLVGTLADAGHLHVSLSDPQGNVVGGHVVSMTIYTTAEVVIGDCTGLVFKREWDKETEFDELTIKNRLMQNQWAYYTDD